MAEPTTRTIRIAGPVAVLAVLLLYVASFGPACWIVMRAGFGDGWINVVYRPVLWGWEYSPHPARNWITIYANILTGSRLVWVPHNGELCYYERNRSIYDIVTGR